MDTTSGEYGAYMKYEAILNTDMYIYGFDWECLKKQVLQSKSYDIFSIFIALATKFGTFTRVEDSYL